MILPPQDLDPQTVSKIEVATRKIAFALNITGPLNIQFIAKNNEIKVIECNVRASRSFPFCSKVLGVDLIEMATRAIVGLPVDPYPTLEIPSNYVAIKVPQFSFSRLLGADPIMGVEMASTGEVACFGKNKFEAYLKALIATGFKIPKKNILISIGSFKEKMEFLPSVKRLHQLGYKLFATTGTSDFIQEHDIPCKYLENLDDEFDNPQKKEYSLSQHLGNNLIDLYINLPSKNHYRRPASYMSRGYRSRRMAVDLAVPLITNIKCAKLFVEALAVSSNFDISSVDFQTCHKTVKLPGFVNVHSFFPNITDQDDTGFEEISKASLSVGFTLICNSPNSISGSIKDSSSMQIAKENCSLNAFCDYTLSFDASKENATTVASMKSDSAFLNVAFDSSSTTNLKSISDLTVHFKSWPVNSLIVANAKDANLATILLLSNLHNRPVHITNVTTREEIELIAMNKEHGGFATCDVCVYNMFVSRLEFDSSLLGTESDVEALWENLAAIDCFSVGSVPYNVAKNLGYDASNSIGIQESICLLLNAVYQGRMTLDDLSARVSNNPRRIFKLPEASDSYVEVELDRSQTMPIAKGKEWAPFGGKRMFGYVQRVVVCGETKFLDGQMFSENHGINVSESCHSVKPLSVSIETQRKPSTKMTTKNRESLPLVSPIGPKSESKIDTVDEVAENTSKDISKTGYIADVPKYI